MPLGLFGDGTGKNPANNAYLGDPTLQKIDQQDYGDNALKTNSFSAQQQSKKMFGQGSDILGQGQAKVNKAGGYFSGVLGDRSQALAAADPEISTVMDQFDAAHKAAAEFSPRGGGRATLNAQKPYQMAGTVGKLLQSARGNAANNLGNLGTSQSGTGLTATGEGTNLLNSSTGAASALEQSDVARDNATKQLISNISKTIAGLIK